MMQTVYKSMLQNALKREEREEIIVKCSLCGDMWHTNSNVGEGEVCTDCDDVFIIEDGDVVSREEYVKTIEEETEMENKTYTYAQLSEQAQAKAREWHQNGREYDIETEYIKENFEHTLEYKGLPNDNVEFSLSYSKGDGVAFYGRVNTTVALLDKLDLTDDSRMILEQAQVNGWVVDADITRNGWANHYAHWNTMDVEVYADDAESIAEDLFEDDLVEYEDGTEDYSEQLAHFTDLVEQAFDELEEALSQYVKDVSRELEAAGYAEFEYYDSDAYIAETLEANEYEFTEDGERA